MLAESVDTGINSMDREPSLIQEDEKWTTLGAKVGLSLRGSS